MTPKLLVESRGFGLGLARGPCFLPARCGVVAGSVHCYSIGGLTGQRTLVLRDVCVRFEDSVLERTKPDAAFEAKVRIGMRQLKAARRMHVLRCRETRSGRCGSKR